MSNREVNVAATRAEGKSARGRLRAKRETKGWFMCGGRYKRA